MKAPKTNHIQPTDAASKTGHEVSFFTYYLVGQAPSDQVRRLYDRSLAYRELDKIKPSKILTFARRHTWSIPQLDAACSLLYPNCDLRQRLYLLFAILECQPELSTSFLPKKYSIWRAAALSLIGLRSGLRVFAGLLLIKGLRLQK